MTYVSNLWTAVVRYVGQRYDSSTHIVCNRHHDEPLLLMSRTVWAELNRNARAVGLPPWIETAFR